MSTPQLMSTVAAMHKLSLYDPAVALDHVSIRRSLTATKLHSLTVIC